MRIGIFLAGTVVASVLVFGVAMVVGFSVWASMGMSVLTAFLAQGMYLIWIARLAREEEERMADEPAAASKPAKEPRSERAKNSL